jgi:hypothetical protein
MATVTERGITAFGALGPLALPHAANVNPAALIAPSQIENRGSLNRPPMDARNARRFYCARARRNSRLRTSNPEASTEREHEQRTENREV